MANQRLYDYNFFKISPLSAQHLVPGALVYMELKPDSECAKKMASRAIKDTSNSTLVGPLTVNGVIATTTNTTIIINHDNEIIKVPVSDILQLWKNHYPQTFLEILTLENEIKILRAQLRDIENRLSANTPTC